MSQPRSKGRRCVWFLSAPSDLKQFLQFLQQVGGELTGFHSHSRLLGVSRAPGHLAQWLTALRAGSCGRRVAVTGAVRGPEHTDALPALPVALGEALAVAEGRPSPTGVSPQGREQYRPRLLETVCPLVRKVQEEVSLLHVLLHPWPLWRSHSSCLSPITPPVPSPFLSG